MMEYDEQNSILRRLGALQIGIPFEAIGALCQYHETMKNTFPNPGDSPEYDIWEAGCTASAFEVELWLEEIRKANIRIRASAIGIIFCSLVLTLLFVAVT